MRLLNVPDVCRMLTEKVSEFLGYHLNSVCEKMVLTLEINVTFLKRLKNINTLPKNSKILYI